jgi:hypothetical protein
MNDMNIGDLGLGMMLYIGQRERMNERRRKGISPACRKGDHENCFEHGCKCECHVDDFY